MGETRDLLATLVVFAGATVGVLKIVDSLLSEEQKAWLRDKAATLWLWLDYQRAGKFMATVKSRRVQQAFSLVIHLSLLMLTQSVVAKAFLGRETPQEVKIGNPRIYPFQVWVDVVALLVSALFVSWKIHPRISRWLGTSASVRRYFLRALAAWGGSACAVFVLLSSQLLLQLLVMGEGDVSFSLGISGMEAPPTAAEVAAYEDGFGGTTGVTVVHAVSALVMAPFLAESTALGATLLFSFGWVLGVILLIVVFRVAQFILYRIEQSRSGPILALSGILIGIGVIAKVLSE